MKLLIDGVAFEVRPGAGGLVVGEAAAPLAITRQERRGETWVVSALSAGRPVRYFLTPLPDGRLRVQAPGGAEAIAERAGATAAAEGPYGPLKAPMAGVVTRLAVAAGESVALGQELAVVEAMKMRFSVASRGAGRVERLRVQEGQLVALGEVLLDLMAVGPDGV